jgi:tetratricopeptide (TPR) repeat protein
LTGDTRLLLGDRDGATSEYEAQWRYYRSPPIRERDRVYGCIADSNGMRAAYLLAHLRADEDRWDDVESCLAHAAEVPEPPYFLDEQVARVAARARLAAHRGSAADAVASAERAVAIAEPTDALPIRALAWLALAVVRQSAGRDDAADALARAVEVHELKGNLAGVALARATFGRDA